MVYIQIHRSVNGLLLLDGRYKLVLSCKEKPWLLDIEKDPLETVNYYEDLQYSEIETDSETSSEIKWRAMMTQP